MSGRIWKFGDDVNTDLIIPGKHLDNYDPAHLASHAMEGANREYAKGVREGDVIVAGRNFGCGSSREQAVIALKHSGIGIIVARSFARIFYRNAVNLGLMVVTSSDAYDVLNDGEEIFFNPDSERLIRTSDGKSVRVDSTPLHVKAILDAGGLMPFVKRRLSAKSGESEKRQA